MNNNIQTLYAPCERVDINELNRQVKVFQNLELLRLALEATNTKVIILNMFRQIVYANKAFIEGTGFTLSDFLGKRPGEALYCIHSDEHPLGCGGSEACRSCAAINEVLFSVKTGLETTKEVAVSIKEVTGLKTLNMLEHVYPVSIQNESFYIVSFIDISDTVRRRELERVFFHDVINTAGALGGYIKLLKDESPEELKAEIEFVADTFDDLVEEIQTQRQLLNAENNELVLDIITIRSCDMLNSIQRLYEKHDIAEGKSIVQSVEKGSDCLTFKSDFVLLKRIIGNMIKNALEETEKGGIVVIGCRKLDIADNQYIEFWVNNQKVIDKDVRHHIFQRAFSTKGNGRGIGTYSMKLLGERYLKGRVDFTSNEKDGTTFFIRLKIE